MKRIRAVLFDMDGLLLDSERLNMDCAQRVAQELGFTLDIAKLARVVCGVRREFAVEAYGCVLPDWVDAAKFYERKNVLLHETLSTEVQPMKGARELLEWLNERHIACVLATATRREAAEQRLSAVKLWDLLPYRVTGDDVTHSKPHPETYLKAAAAAGVRPEECLVLEDSFNGIRAGRASGAVVGMVPDTLPYSDECAPYCDQVFDDLTQVIAWMKEP